MPINGQHTVAAAEPPILCGQAPFQQVENENTRLISPPHELNAELFTGVALMERHVEDVFSWRGPFRMAVRSVTKTSLTKHSEMQGAAGLWKHSSGIVVGHIADIVVVDLKYKNCDPRVTIFYFLNL